MLINLLVFFPMALSPLIYALGRTGGESGPGRRDALCAAAAFAELVMAALLLFMTYGMTAQLLGVPGTVIPVILPSGLSFQPDGFRSSYALITALMWFFTTVFSKEYFAGEEEETGAYQAFFIFTLGAVEGVMLSADIMTAFVFFELLSLSSFTWVMQERSREALRAGYTYLFIALTGGLILFMGLLLLQCSAGTFEFSALAERSEEVSNSAGRGYLLPSAVCVMLGFGAKAGMFPLHVWLPKAHPVAPSPASALLSGVLTKVGVYGILMSSLTAFAFLGEYGLTLLALGIVTMFTGAVLACFSVNLKRTLACSSMSQIGFILTGIGSHVLCTSSGLKGEACLMSLSGSVLHMVNHSLIKLDLFMCAGVVVMNLHSLNLDDIRGYGRNKADLKAAFLLGALGIGGVPLFSGYLSKTMLHEGLVLLREGFEAAGSPSYMVPFLTAAEWIFLLSGGMTCAYMLKLFVCIFVEKNGDPLRQAEYERSSRCMNGASRAVIITSALFMALLGQPAVTKGIAAFMTGEAEIYEFVPFSAGNLKGGAISIAAGLMIYAFVVRKVFYKDGSYADLWPAGLDLEEGLYRPMFTRWLPAAGGAAASLFAENKILKPLCGTVLSVSSLLAGFLCDGLDVFIVIMRRTLLRSRHVRNEGHIKAGLWRIFLQKSEEVTHPRFAGFSFALIMTCLGILLILLSCIYAL